MISAGVTVMVSAGTGSFSLQVAVTMTFSAGMVNVVVALLALVKVTLLGVTVQPVKVWPGLLPAWMVTVTPS